MPNRNYVNGRAREYRAINHLIAAGCSELHTFRSAGSHSEIDVIGIDIERRRIFLLQCKPESLSQSKRDEILERNVELQGEFLVSFEVV